MIFFFLHVGNTAKHKKKHSSEKQRNSWSDDWDRDNFELNQSILFPGVAKFLLYLVGIVTFLFGWSMLIAAAWDSKDTMSDNESCPQMHLIHKINESVIVTHNQTVVSKPEKS